MFIHRKCKAGLFFHPSQSQRFRESEVKFSSKAANRNTGNGDTKFKGPNLKVWDKGSSLVFVDTISKSGL